MNLPQIRYKRISDTDYEIHDVMKLADAYRHDNHQFKHLPYDRELVRTHVINALKSGEHFIILAYHGNKPVGGFWGYTAEQIFSPVKFGYDAFSFMLPEYRGMGIARELVKLAETEFRKFGAKIIVAGANSGIHGNGPAIKMYESLGYEGLGVNLGKTLK